MPVAGVPALAGVADAGEPDPVFGLIDAAKQERAYLDEYFDNLDGQPASLVEAGRKCETVLMAEMAAIAAKATTSAGLVTQLMFAAEWWAQHDGYIVSPLVNAARMLDGPLVSKIGLSERLANAQRRSQA